ncbi:MAG: biotin/lipoyl-binding protein [Rhodobacteraceae bacterium]|nr:biotin/lipoyl-binding protein [Paracoccaceae bacterium]
MSSPNLHPMLNVAVKAARAAGAIINRAALDVESVRVSQKQVNDFVTEVDQASEDTIIETLLTAYPGHGIWAEESGREHGAKDSEFVWIIDPLDRETSAGQGGDVALSPMPGLVRAVLVTAGQAVAAGERLAVLEAMKMEHALTAGRDGVVAEVLCAEGDQVEAGVVLVRLVPEGEA